MKIAWNWIGIIVWILILVYFIWMIFSMHYWGRKAIQKDKRYFGIKTYVLVSTLQFVILLLMVSGMLILRFHKDDSGKNIAVKKYYEPMVLDTNGRHSYYVKVQKTHNSLNPQTYSYLTKGHREYISSANAILYNATQINNVPLMYHTSKTRLNELDHRYQRAWSIRVVAKYKNNWINGLALRANTDADHHALIRVPDNSFIYIEK